MTDKELIQMAESDDTVQALAELYQALDDALAKPKRKRDYVQINALVKRIGEMTGEDETASVYAERGLEQLPLKIAQGVKQKKRIPRKKIARVTAVFASISLVLMNMVSYEASGSGLSSSVFQWTPGRGLELYMSRTETSNVLLDSNPYAEDMRAIYDELGFDGQIPGYIPSGFEPASYFGRSYVYPDNEIDITFSWVKKNPWPQDNSIINLHVEHYRLGVGFRPMYARTEGTVISEQIIDGTRVYIFKGDKYYSVFYLVDNTQYQFTTTRVDFEDSYRILRSLFDQETAS